MHDSEAVLSYWFGGLDDLYDEGDLFEVAFLKEPSSSF